MADTNFGDIGALESVKTAISSAAEMAASSARQAVLGEIQYMLERSAFESPIEAMFYAYFTAIAASQGGLIYAQPQVSVSVGGVVYRPDFTVEPVDTDVAYEMYLYRVPALLIAIELDGHDFHERTKEQVAYRNQRDRDLQAAGWMVLHYSGSELHRNPQRVAGEAYSIVWKEWSDRIRQLRDAKRPLLEQLEAARR